MLVESGNFFHMQLYSTHPLSMTKLRQIIWFEGTRMIMLLGGITNRHTEHRNTLGCSKLISLFSKQCSDTPWSCWGTLGKAVGYMWLLLTRRYRTWFCWHSTATSWLLSYNPDNRPSLNTSSGAGLPHSGSKNYVRCSYFTTKYCDEHVYLSIRLHIPKTTCAIFVNFVSMLRMALAWSSFVSFVICSSGFVDDVMFSDNEPNGTSRVCLSSKSVTAKSTTTSILTKFDSTKPAS